MAKIMDISEAQVSRYIALLDLPPEVQQQVATGELPVTQPLKALKRRAKERKPTVSVLNHNQRLVIETLARTLYATQSQLARYADKSVNAIRIAINDLADARFLESSKELRPFVYRLSSHGTAIAGAPKPRHWMSANAIHQRVLRNEIELAMRERNASATFMERTACWKMGLFPSVGEHLLTYSHQGRDQKALVIIDDYLMDSKRIERSLKRLHDKDKNYASGDLVLAWKDVVDTIFVYTTDAKHKDHHEAFIDQQLGDISQPIVVRHIPAVWEVL
ncbi:MAG: hypothetical protein R3208_14075 [Ketobacteraceae bacterium]|nr:hypothetical protein [Ketobacteraceae bacterium]